MVNHTFLEETINKYCHVNESIYLTEDIKTFLEKFSVEKLKRLLRDTEIAVKEKNVNAIQNIIKKIPIDSKSKVEDAMNLGKSKLGKSFDNNMKYALSVIKNSTNDHDPKLVQTLATVIAATSSISKESKSLMKKSLQKSMFYLQGYDETSIDQSGINEKPVALTRKLDLEMIMAYVFATIAVIAIAIPIMGAMVLTGYLITTLSGLTTAIIIILICLIILLLRIRQMILLPERI